jgi:PAP2 superfamily
MIQRMTAPPATTAPEPPTPEPPAPADRQPASPRRRVYAMAVWLGLFAGACFLLGVPTDPIYLFACLWTATIAWNIDQPWRFHLRFIRDWAAIIALLVIYNATRGLADNGTTPHAQALIRADVSMWGWATGGQTPPVWLQQHLYDPVHVQWWDALVSLVYFSHFVTVPGIALVLWLRNRSIWGKFMRRWVTLFAAGLITYFIYPAAPPWLAAQNGLIPPIDRISTRGWKAIGLHSAGNLLNAAQIDASNPVAAMPSLHTAFTVLAVGFFFSRVPARWWPLLAAYPLAMVFTLVYSGEHWVIDALVGMGYAVAVLLGVSAAERWWANRGRARWLARFQSRARSQSPASWRAKRGRTRRETSRGS